MKKAFKILSVCMMIALVLTMSTMSAFAGTLTLDETVPKDNSKGASIENMSVKLKFTGSTFTSDVLGDKNTDCFKLLDPDGNEMPYKVLYAPKEDGVVTVIFDSTATDDEGNKIYDGSVQSKSTYQLVISGDFQDDNGNTLGQDKTITFTTINQKANSLLSTGLMFAILAVIFIFSGRSAKKAEDKNKKEKTDEKVNPYKESKKSGKALTEVVQKSQTKKDAKAERAAKAEAKKKEKMEKMIAKFADKYDFTYHLKARRPISAAGGVTKPHTR